LPFIFWSKEGGIESSIYGVFWSVVFLACEKGKLRLLVLGAGWRCGSSDILKSS